MDCGLDSVMRINIIRVSFPEDLPMFHVSQLNDVPGVAHDADTRGHAHDRLQRVPEPIELDSLRLLGGQRELRIRHGNEIYRLRHTRNDKLILTK